MWVNSPARSGSSESDSQDSGRAGVLQGALVLALSRGGSTEHTPTAAIDHSYTAPITLEWMNTKRIGVVVIPIHQEEGSKSPSGAEKRLRF